MKDIEIKISQETRMVGLKKTVIGNDAENLQGNLIFSFTDNFVNGTARLEYEIAGNKRYIMLEKNNNTYSVPIKSVLTKKGQINMQLVITEGTSENDIPIFKSNIFYVFCNQSINAEIEQPDEYPSWIEIANSKINEIDEAILGVEEAKRYAIEKGDYAKEQGDYAKAQGDYAKTQKIEVVKANEEANRIINNFETNVGEYTTAFNENANNKTNDFDSNAESKTSGFNQNVDNKISEYNNNASEKLSAYNTNAENKKSEFDTNAANQTKAFNDNATNKTTAFNSNANSKTETYNNNHTEKLNTYNTNATNKTTEFNTNATSKLNAYNTNADTKLQEYNTNADNKILEYDSHSEELDNKIIDTRNELERVKNDVLETGTDTDTYIHLEDSAMAEYQELSVDGVCEQETSLYNGTIEQGTLTNGEVSTANDRIRTKDFIEVLPNTSLPISFSGVTDYVAVEYGSNKDFITQTAWLSSGTEFEVPTGVYFIKLIFKGNGGITPSSISNLKVGNVPNPDYPQEIKTIENSLKITSCNKNFFNKNNPFNYGNGTDGKTVLLDDATIQTTVNFGDNRSKGQLLFLKNNTIYTISGNLLRADGTGLTYNAVLEIMGEKNGKRDIIKNYLFNSSVSKPFSFKMSFDTKDYINISIHLNSWDVDISKSPISIFNDIQLEENSTATPFEQHIETQITANLPEGEFIGKINETYKDTLKVEYNEEDGQYHLNLYKNVGKQILILENTITHYNNNHWLNFSKPINSAMYNNFKRYPLFMKFAHYSDNNYELYSYQTGLGGFFSGIICKEDEDVSSLKEIVDGSEYYYPLAESYVVDLGVVDQLLSYDKVSNVFTNSDLLPQINLKYYRNFESTVRNLQVNEKALKQELIDINNRLSALETAQTSTTSESEVIE